VTPEQAAEFRGLFFGEGHIDLAQQGARGTLTPRLRIAVRDDDADVVRWCRDLLGGNLSRRAATRSVCWQLTARDAVAYALTILEEGTIPSKKRAEVRLLRQAVALVPQRGAHSRPGATARLRQLRDDLKRQRRYMGAT
jgi:hypothetical protein